MAADPTAARRTLAAVAWIVLTVPSAATAADRAEPLPEELRGVEVVERIGGPLPLERAFLDQSGGRVLLGDLFGRGRPVLITFNYSSCPMLCHVQRDGLIEALKHVDWTPGREFDVVTIVIDPRETPERSAATRRAALKAYGRPEAAPGWTFLTGREADVRAVADAAGFGYRYVPARDEYAHSAALVIGSAEGAVLRYLYGVKFDPAALKQAIADVAGGKAAAGSPLERILMYCFHYDPSTRRYGPTAMNVMRLGAVLATAALLAFLVRSWIRDQPGASSPNPLDAPVNEAAV